MVTRIEFRKQFYNEREYNSEIDTIFRHYYLPKVTPYSLTFKVVLK